MSAQWAEDDIEARKYQDKSEFGQLREIHGRPQTKKKGTG